MTQQEDKTKQLLKLARISFNTSFLVLISCVVALLVSSLPVVTKKTPLEKPLAENIISVDEIDSSEIKNGIHIPTGLIADTSFNLVVINCTRCHSIEVVKQNRATREGWKKMITWMQKTQGLWSLGENEEPILNYLAKNYPPSNSGRRKNLENIVWYKLK
jgi:hypothetical protein